MFELQALFQGLGFFVALQCTAVFQTSRSPFQGSALNQRSTVYGQATVGSLVTVSTLQSCVLVVRAREAQLSIGLE
jgi:hypothetical protein